MDSAGHQLESFGTRSGTGSCWERQKWVEDNPDQPFSSSCPIGEQMFYKDGTTVYDSEKWNAFNAEYRRFKLDEHIHQICKYCINQLFWLFSVFHE